MISSFEKVKGEEQTAERKERKKRREEERNKKEMEGMGWRRSDRCPSAIRFRH